MEKWMLKKIKKERPDLYEQLEELAKNSKDGYLFSKDLRNMMEPFMKKNIDECLQDPNFYNHLLKHSGHDEQSRKKVFEEMGRPDLYRD
jgi:hypothetical protein